MRFIFATFILTFAFLLGTAGAAFASHDGVCNEQGYNGAGDCQLEVIYGDSGGSNLQACQYRVVSNGAETLGWTNASEGSCSGQQASMWTGAITMGSGLNCRDEGTLKCQIYARAVDNGNNETITLIATLDIDYEFPQVSASNASSQWFTSRTTTLSISDSGTSGLAEARYSWDSNAMNSSCTSGGIGFANGTALTVPQGSHRLYLCARDGATNVTNWDSGPDQYRVDPIAPEVQSFSINGTSCSGFNCPATVIATSSVSITWTASDTGGSGIQKHEVWRAPDAGGSPGSWNRIQDNAASPYTDNPGNGIWWYGVHAIDNTGSCIDEQGNHCGGVQSDSLDNRTVRGPIKVIFGDQTAPKIDSFSVTPTAWTSGSITITWSVSDTGGSGINRVEVWRAPNGQGAEKINPNANSPFFDSPSEGLWWYGIHVVDGVENCIMEDTSDPVLKGHCGGVASDNLDIRTDWGPVQVRVDKTKPSTPTNLQPTGVVTSQSVLFEWDDAVDNLSGVASYRIQVDQSSQFNNPEIDTTTSVSSYSSGSVGNGNQYWRVQATDNAGNVGDWASASFNHQPNQPPNASFNCTPSNCTVYNTENLTFNNNSTDPDGSSDITRSEWDILSYNGSPDTTCTQPNALCNHTLQPISPNTYTMQLRAQDSAGTSDTDQRSFTVRRDTVAGFMCSLDNVNFVACSSLSGQISEDEVLYLKDSSSLSEYTVVSENASSVTSRTWKLNGTPFSTGNNSNPSTIVPTSGTVTLELDAQDNQGRSDTQTHTLNPQIPFPEFQEISPF